MLGRGFSFFFLFSRVFNFKCNFNRNFDKKYHKVIDNKKMNLLNM